MEREVITNARGRKRAVQAGQRCFQRVPKSHPRFMDGTFLGMRDKIGEHIVGSGHNIVYARTIRGRLDSKKWKVEKLESIKVGPPQAETRARAKGERKEMEPLEDESQGGSVLGSESKEIEVHPKRRAMIMREDITNAGVTVGCLGCRAEVGCGKLGTHWPSC